MKIIKLHQRFKMYQEGFTHALRWDRWEYSKVTPYEKALAKLYGRVNYNYRESNWASMFAANPGPSGYKAYFIYVRSEAMITAAMLRVELA